MKSKHALLHRDWHNFELSHHFHDSASHGFPGLQILIGEDCLFLFVFLVVQLLELVEDLLFEDLEIALFLGRLRLFFQEDELEKLFFRIHQIDNFSENSSELIELLQFHLNKISGEKNPPLGPIVLDLLVDVSYAIYYFIGLILLL